MIILFYKMFREVCAPWLVRTRSLYFRKARALHFTSALLRYTARSLCHRNERVHFIKELKKLVPQALLSYIGTWEFGGGRGAGGWEGGRGEGDEDYGCVTIKFTWSPHQALLYSNGPLHQKSVFYSPLPLNSVKRLLMSLCSPEAMWRPPPPNKKEIPGLHLIQAKN